MQRANNVCVSVFDLGASDLYANSLCYAVEHHKTTLPIKTYDRDVLVS